MNTNTVDAKILGRMFLSGAKNLEAKKEWINELNVFPVPDGDTGTNMTLTIMSAASEVNALSDPDMKSLAKAISSGSLRGARGNSGVILSQLLRGFTKVIEKCDEIDAPTFARAFERAVETAYKAVMKPKEGTILTRGLLARGAFASPSDHFGRERLFGNVEKRPDRFADVGVLPVGGDDVPGDRRIVHRKNVGVIDRK